MENPLEGMTIVEFQQFSQMIGDVAAGIIMDKINDSLLYIATPVFTALISAISFLYTVQRKDATEAKEKVYESYGQMKLIISESKKTMNSVKDQLDECKKREAKVSEAINTINEGLESLQKQNEEVIKNQKKYIKLKKGDNSAK